MSKEVLLDVRHLTQQFHLTKKIKVKAVDDVSFQIHKGEIFGLVGESGSGKSTVARCLMNIYQPAQGEIWYKDVNICDKKEFKKHKKMLQTRRQMIFQDSASSLNQKMKVSDIITEPMRIQHITPPRGSFVKEAAFQMEYVGLENSFLDRYPSELSGGQRQRVAVESKMILLLGANSSGRYIECRMAANCKIHGFIIKADHFPAYTDLVLLQNMLDLQLKIIWIIFSCGIRRF